MTKNILLDELKKFTEETMKDMILPTRLQKGEEEQEFRCPGVYKMRLPDGTKAMKYAPYVLHTVITGHDYQNENQRTVSTVQIRTIFCTYSDDEQEGGLALLEMMERFRIGLLKQVSIGHQFTLERKEAIETMVYIDDTAPYYAGEMITSWIMPSVEREVIL